MCLFQFWFPQGIRLGEGLLGHMVVLFLVFFFKKYPYRLPQWLYQFTLPPTVQQCSLFSTPSPAFIVCTLFGTKRRRQWHPTLVLLPGKSHGQRSLVGCSPWGRKESDMTQQLHFHALKKEMATHSSILAWRIPGTGEPGGLPSMGSHRVRHN